MIQKVVSSTCHVLGFGGGRPRGLTFSLVGMYSLPNSSVFSLVSHSWPLFLWILPLVYVLPPDLESLSGRGKCVLVSLPVCRPSAYISPDRRLLTMPPSTVHLQKIFLSWNLSSAVVSCSLFSIPLNYSFLFFYYHFSGTGNIKKKQQNCHLISFID